MYCIKVHLSIKNVLSILAGQFMSKLVETLAKNLKRFRQDKGFTQQEFADLAGVKRGTIARYESGEGGIDAKTIEAFAKALGVEETDLVQAETKESMHMEKMAGSIKKLSALMEEYFVREGVTDPTPEELERIIQESHSIEPLEAELYDPLIRESVTLLASFDEAERKRALSLIQSLARTTNKGSGLGKKAK
jgi:transcriptional regulator with XRE-family HTH domain